VPGLVVVLSIARSFHAAQSYILGCELLKITVAPERVHELVAHVSAIMPVDSL
jgi:hypothetical protein